MATTKDQLLALLADPEARKLLAADPQASAMLGQVVKEQKDAAKEQAEKDREKAAELFAEVRESFDQLFDDIKATHELQTYYRKDRKTGERTTDVSSKGYKATGVGLVLDFGDGVLHEARVDISARYWPNKGSMPVTLTTPED